MNTMATYIQRNWYYGFFICAAVILSTQYGADNRQMNWYLWILSGGLLVVIGFLFWRNNREHNGLYVQKEVLDTIVHEFQTPISAIKMAADILATPFGRSSQERTDKYIHIIQEETQRLQQQVDVMLSLARADRDHSPREPSVSREGGARHARLELHQEPHDGDDGAEVSRRGPA